MKKTIRICDKCEKPISDSHERENPEFMLFSNRRSNGTESENWYWSADLCQVCLKIALRMALERLEKLMDENQRKNLAQVFNAKEV